VLAVRRMWIRCPLDKCRARVIAVQPITACSNNTSMNKESTILQLCIGNGEKVIQKRIVMNKNKQSFQPDQVIVRSNRELIRKPAGSIQSNPVQPIHNTHTDRHTNFKQIDSTLASNTKRSQALRQHTIFSHNTTTNNGI